MSSQESIFCSVVPGSIRIVRDASGRIGITFLAYRGAATLMAYTLRAFHADGKYDLPVSREQGIAGGPIMERGAFWPSGLSLQEIQRIIAWMNAQCPRTSTSMVTTSQRAAGVSGLSDGAPFNGISFVQGMAIGAGLVGLYFTTQKP